MTYLINLIQNHLQSKDEKSEKTTFWATESETNAFDIYHRWKGTESTNPIIGEKLMMFQSAKLIEQAYVNMFKEIGILVSSNTEQERIEMIRKGVPISGYMDSIIKYMGKEIICEIKTFYGDYQEKELLEGKPRESYLKQLAVYMDATNTDEGMLFYINRGTGTPFQFILQRNGSKFACNGVSFDIMDTYSRWASIYAYIERNEEPPSDYKYKYDIETLDWKTVSKTDISKARNGHKVIGDWQATYSPYLDLIIEREGTQRGYTLEELEKIKELTSGFTNW